MEEDEKLNWLGKWTAIILIGTVFLILGATILSSC